MKMLIVLLVAISAASSVYAHKVKCFAAMDGDKIAGYAWMSGGVRPKGVPFQVMDSKGKVLLEGKTDDNGEFSFVPPKVESDLTIVVTAGPGHQAKFTVKRNELSATTVSKVDGGASKTSASAVAATSAESPAAPSNAELEKMIERAVASQIVPLRAELAEFEDKERLRDIFAGLGYIAGIAGAAFFFFGSKRTKD